MRRGQATLFLLCSPIFQLNNYFRKKILGFYERYKNLNALDNPGARSLHYLTADCKTEREVARLCNFLGCKTKLQKI